MSVHVNRCSVTQHLSGAAGLHTSLCPHLPPWLWLWQHTKSCSLCWWSPYRSPHTVEFLSPAKRRSSWCLPQTPSSRPAVFRDRNYNDRKKTFCNFYNILDYPDVQLFHRIIFADVQYSPLYEDFRKLSAATSGPDRKHPCFHISVWCYWLQ